MSEVSKKKQKFRIEIRQKEKDDYCRKIRQRLLVQERQFSENSHLRHLVKTSLLKNGLCQQIREVINELYQIINKQDIMAEYEYIIAICSNALIDDLQLEEKESITGILYRVYQLLENEMSNSKAIYHISYSMVSFANVIPYLHENFAADCEAMLLKLALAIIESIVCCTYTDDVEDVAAGVMMALSNLISYEPEYKSQLEHSFSQNISYYDQLIKLHQTSLKDTRQHHCLTVRNGMLHIFQKLSLDLTMNSFPYVFESQYFIGFVVSELLSASSAQWEKMSLNILTNLLIDYEVCDGSGLITVLQQIDSKTITVLFKKLLANSCNALYTTKFIKTVISMEKVYKIFERFFDEYWREVVDYCLEIVKNSSNLELIRITVFVLLILGEVLPNRASYHQHLRNYGAIPLFDDLLMQLTDTREHQLQKQASEISSAVKELLYNLQDE